MNQIAEERKRIGVTQADLMAGLNCGVHGFTQGD
ncbi:Uncharacterised protein [Yersinia intermedia]|nr:Uncharacterised protein [Yersinia intermedia]